MYSLDHKLDLGNALIPACSDSLSLLKSLGLVRDPKQLPVFSLFDLFETFLKGQRVTARRIKQKISALHGFLVSSQLQRANVPFIQSLIHCVEQTARDLETENLFYNNLILNLFSYAFGLRLEIYHSVQGRVSVQYFGFKSKPVQRALMTSDSYVVLKVAAAASEVALSRRMGKGLSPVSSYNRLNSYRTMVTRATEQECVNLELNRCESDNTAISNPSGNLNKKGKGPGNLIYNDLQKSLYEDDGANYELDPMSELTKCQSAVYKDSAPSRPLRSGNKSDFALTGSEAPRIQQTPLSHPVHNTKDQPVTDIGAKSEGKLLGRLKFYNEAKEYGFIIMDDESEIFVHKADLVKQNIDTRYLAYYKKYYEILMAFTVQEYQGRSKKHRKAVDVLICEMQAIC